MTPRIIVAWELPADPLGCYMPAEWITDGPGVRYYGWRAALRAARYRRDNGYRVRVREAGVYRDNAPVFRGRVSR